MAHIKCDLFTVDSDVLVDFNIFDDQDDPASEITGASTVDLTFYHADDDVALAGVSWPLDMTPYDSGRSKYLASVPKAADVTIGEMVWAEVVVVDATAGEATFVRRNIPVVEHVPE
jgi:hypothetical protein